MVLQLTQEEYDRLVHVLNVNLKCKPKVCRKITKEKRDKIKALCDCGKGVMHIQKKVGAGTTTIKKIRDGVY